MDGTRAGEFYSGGYIAHCTVHNAQLHMCGPSPLPLDKVVKWPE